MTHYLDKKYQTDKQVSLKDWVKRYNINVTALADLIGVGRSMMYAVMNKEAGLRLENALRLYYHSSGAVDMFTLMVNGEELREELKEVINLTKRNKKHLAGIKNSIKRNETTILGDK